MLNDYSLWKWANAQQAKTQRALRTDDFHSINDQARHNILILHFRSCVASLRTATYTDIKYSQMEQ